jgi:hypothetical protein
MSASSDLEDESDPTRVVAVKVVRVPRVCPFFVSKIPIIKIRTAAAITITITLRLCRPIPRAKMATLKYHQRNGLARLNNIASTGRAAPSGRRRTTSPSSLNISLGWFGPRACSSLRCLTWINIK